MAKNELKKGYVYNINGSPKIFLGGQIYNQSGDRWRNKKLSY